MIAGTWGTASASLPSGWAPGQLAILVEVVDGAGAGLPDVPAGWSPQGATPVRVAPGVMTWARVSTRALRFGDTGPTAPVGAAWAGRILVDESGAPSIRVSTGAARVTAREGAWGIIVGATDTNADPAGTGVEWLPGRTQAGSLAGLGWLVGLRWVSIGMSGEGTAGSASVTGLGIEVLAPQGPRPPELTSPAAGDEVNAVATTQWSWQHRSSRAGGSQGGWSWRISSAAGWLYWSAATSSLTLTETTNPGASMSFDLPGGALDNLGASRVWTVRTVEALDGMVSLWAPERTVTPVSPPGLAVSVAATHNDLSPTMTGTATITRPGSVVIASQWQARDATSGAVVWDSGVQGGAGLSREAPASTTWANGGSYTGWGRIQQTGGAWSAWSSSAPFVVSWTAPATPVVTVTTDPEGGVFVHTTALTPGAEVVVESSRDDGLTWELVHHGVAPASTMQLRDPLVAHMQPMRWSVTQYVVVDGVRLPSERGVSNVVVPSSRVSILASAYDPASTWQQIYIADDPAVAWPRLTAVQQVFDDEYALVLRGKERARRGELTVTAKSADAREALHLLTQCGDPLVLQLCPEDDWGRQSIQPGERVTLQVISEHSETRLKHIAWQPRNILVTWVEARTPRIGEAPALAPITHPVESPSAVAIADAYQI